MKISLFINKLYLAFLKRTGVTANKKSFAVWKAKGYDNAPEISFIIQSHNKSLEVKHIVSKLRLIPQAEIVVLDDGSTIIHTERLASALTGANEFLIHGNDLYENVMYDKAIRFANGKYLVLLQDDDDFADLSWVEKGIAYLKKYPKMVVLGGNGGHDFILDDEKKEGLGIPYKDKWMNKEFRFVHHVDRAPMFVNKELFIEKLQHIDFDFAPFQFDDCEMCLRAWLNGLQVGWFNAGFTSLSAGGMRVWNNSFTGEQCERNAALLYKKYQGKKNVIDVLVKNACENL